MPRFGRCTKHLWTDGCARLLLLFSVPGRTTRLLMMSTHKGRNHI